MFIRISFIFTSAFLIGILTINQANAKKTYASEVSCCDIYNTFNISEVQTGRKSDPSESAIFVSPNGNADAPGSIDLPTTLPMAIKRISAGSFIYLRGGTYQFEERIKISNNNHGFPNAHKHIFAYPGETPILNFSQQAKKSSNRGLIINGNYWHLNGLIIEHAKDNGLYVSGSHNIVQNIVTRYNHDTGIQIGRANSSISKDLWPAHNLIVSCESHDNKDETGENADGFAAKLTVGPGNVFRYNVAHHNSDDGWDLFTKPETGPISPVTIEYSIAFENGTLSDGTMMSDGDRNGFKLGGQQIPVAHIIHHNLAYNNGKHGFTYNKNPGQISMVGNLAINNAKRGYNFPEGQSHFSQNTSCNLQGSKPDKAEGDDDGTNSWWNRKINSACDSYQNKTFTWSFNPDGSLRYQFE